MFNWLWYVMINEFHSFVLKSKYTKCISFDVSIFENRKMIYFSLQGLTRIYTKYTYIFWKLYNTDIGITNGKY